MIIEHLTIRRMRNTIMIHHEDGRRLGFIDAHTGQCRDARRGEGVGAWLAGVGVTVEEVIARTGAEQNEASAE